MRVLLLRFADTPFGVFGRLIIEREGAPTVRLWTLEDDWLDNKAGESAIPAGRYKCVESVWHGGGEVPTFEITGVPGGRSRILFHYGNTEEDVKGCVVVGLDLAALTVGDEDAPGAPKRSKWGIVESRAAFAEFRRALAGVKEFEFEVVWAQPGAWRTA